MASTLAGVRWGPPGEELLAEDLKPGLLVMVFSRTHDLWFAGAVAADGEHVEFRDATGVLCRKRLHPGSACFKACCPALPQGPADRCAAPPLQPKGRPPDPGGGESGEGSVSSETEGDQQPHGSLRVSDLRGFWQGLVLQVIWAVGSRFVYEDGSSDEFSVSGSRAVSMRRGGATRTAELRGGALLWDDGEVWTRPCGDASPQIRPHRGVASALLSLVPGLSPPPPPETPWAVQRARRTELLASSLILEDGTYQPGTCGGVSARDRQAEVFFRTFPDVKAKFEQHDPSWQFHHQHMATFSMRLSDGFRRFAVDEILLFHKGDEKLVRFMSELRRMPEIHNALEVGQVLEVQKEALVCLSAAVAEACGGNVSARYEKKQLQLWNVWPPADFHIGNVLGGPLVGRLALGFGVCRHRALLFKYACDELGLADCAAVSGVFVQRTWGGRRKRPGDHMWNIVRVSGAPFLVDCMNAPGQLLTSQGHIVSLKGNTFHRENGRSGFSLDAASPGDGPLPHADSDSAADPAALASCLGANEGVSPDGNTSERENGGSGSSLHATSRAPDDAAYPAALAAHPAVDESHVISPDGNTSDRETGGSRSSLHVASLGDGQVPHAIPDAAAHPAALAPRPAVNEGHDVSPGGNSSERENGGGGSSLHAASHGDGQAQHATPGDVAYSAALAARPAVNEGHVVSPDGNTFHNENGCSGCSPDATNPGDGHVPHAATDIAAYPAALASCPDVNEVNAEPHQRDSGATNEEQQEHLHLYPAGGMQGCDRAGLAHEAVRFPPVRERVCSVCMDAQVDARLRPCFHVTLCSACAALLVAEGHGCPLCRFPAEGYDIGEFQCTFDNRTSEQLGTTNMERTAQGHVDPHATGRSQRSTERASQDRAATRSTGRRRGSTSRAKEDRTDSTERADEDLAASLARPRES